MTTVSEAKATETTTATMSTRRYTASLSTREKAAAAAGRLAVQLPALFVSSGMHIDNYAYAHTSFLHSVSYGRFVYAFTLELTSHCG